MSTKKYTVKYRRKLEKKTDYRSRRLLLSSGVTRVVVRKSLNNFIVQFVDYYPGGDRVVCSAHSRELIKYGWNGHRGNIPCAYLVGYLAGLKAVKKKKINKAILDLGLNRIVKGSSFFAALKGVLDAGVEVKHSEKIIPNGDSLKGVVIENYAKKLLENKERYEKQFSGYLKRGLKPGGLSKHITEVKEKIDRKWRS